VRPSSLSVEQDRLVLGDYGFSLGVLYRGGRASRGHNAPVAATLAEIERQFVLEVVPARQHP
jgi:2-oxoglutarate/2-oxoacid ferredoxin oxidoreductase subunit beta